MYEPGKKRPMAEINVVPFIDVMLVLLVVFMITAPLLTQGVKVELPKTQAKALTEQEKEPLIVTVDSEGKFYLNLADKPNQAITARTLSYLVTSQLAKQSSENGRPVLVRGDKNANYGKVMEAMSLLQQAGANSVGLITQPAPQDKKLAKQS
ncbi:MAG: protein TolR [Gammaproteobacteria bacterium RIFCSPHIGHO2_12_FULL_43_28]|nr:MAG: protein TolR [Gammaproteobacteria bacterium RIFCSPHIGHO2_12_FULL_43_28]